MARDIDPEKIKSGDLTYDEAKYLSDRGRLPEEFALEAFAPEAPETMEDVVIQKYEVDTKYTPLEDQEVPTISNRGGIVGDDEDEEGEEDYLEGWNNDSRRAELSRRGLSVNGNKEEMISRLRRSDTEQLTDEDYSEA